MVYSFKQIRNECHGGTFKDRINKIRTLTKYLNQLLVRQEEKAWEPNSLLFQEIHEATSDNLTILIIFHQNRQEIFLEVYSENLRGKLELLSRRYVKLLDSLEEFCLCRERFCYFIKTENCVQVDEVSLVKGPLIDELNDVLDNFFYVQ